MTKRVGVTIKSESMIRGGGDEDLEKEPGTAAGPGAGFSVSEIPLAGAARKKGQRGDEHGAEGHQGEGGLAGPR
jgi:hypothetical protein